MSQRQLSLQEKVTLIIHFNDAYDIPLSVMCKAFNLKESTLLRHQEKTMKQESTKDRK
jgi:hypothetical protein